MPPEPLLTDAGVSGDEDMGAEDAAAPSSGAGTMPASSSEADLASASSSSNMPMGGMDYRLSWICDQALTHLSVEQHAFDAFWHHLDSRGVASHAAAVVHFLDVAPLGSTLLMYTTQEDLAKNVQRIHLSTTTMSDQIGRYRTIYILKNQNGPIKKPKDEEEVGNDGNRSEGARCKCARASLDSYPDRSLCLLFRVCADQGSHAVRLRHRCAARHKQSPDAGEAD